MRPPAEGDDSGDAVMTDAEPAARNMVTGLPSEMSWEEFKARYRRERQERRERRRLAEEGGEVEGEVEEREGGE